jgi:hypothetical protein
MLANQESRSHGCVRPVECVANAVAVATLAPRSSREFQRLPCAGRKGVWLLALDPYGAEVIEEPRVRFPTVELRVLVDT